MPIRVNYKELDFFKVGHKLSLEIYKITKEFPKEERFGLISQLQRASVSICSNIAEGAGRNTTKDFKHFLHNALGSAREIEYQLLLCKDLNYIQVSTYDRLNSLINEIIGKLVNYIKGIQEN